MALFAVASVYADTVYVANALDGTIAKFDSNGVGTVFISSTAHTNNLGLDFDSGGNLHLAIWDNSTVTKYDSNGQGTIITNTDLFRPTGLAFDSRGSLYVSCYYTNRIVKSWSETRPES